MKIFQICGRWKCEFIGVSGQTNDRKHHQLSNILKEQDFFLPYLTSDPLIFHDHGDPYDMSINNQSNVQRSFLSSGPNLQVEARALIFVPGGPYPKMHLFWKIPSNLLDDELHRNSTLVKVEIARQLPLFKIGQALSEIRNLLGLVTGMMHRSVSLIEKLLNIKERKDSSQEKNQLSNLANMIMHNARDKDGRNVRPQCNSCVDKGLDRVSYGKAQPSVETANKHKRD
jgi:hypothetical protein